MKLRLLAPLKNALKWVYKAGEGIADAEERIMWAEPMSRKPIMWVSHGRSFVKAVTWRITGTVDTFVLTYIITKKIKFAIAISATEVFTKIFLYYMHERVWNKVKWGRE
jgi:uncharacterized membrane protein